MLEYVPQSHHIAANQIQHRFAASCVYILSSSTHFSRGASSMYLRVCVGGLYLHTYVFSNRSILAGAISANARAIATPLVCFYLGISAVRWCMCDGDGDISRARSRRSRNTFGRCTTMRAGHDVCLYGGRVIQILCVYRHVRPHSITGQTKPAITHTWYRIRLRVALS